MTMTFFRLAGSGTRAAVGAAAVVLLCSCQPYQQTGGDISVTLGSSEMILLDAPARSCRAELETSTSDDVGALHMNMGRMTVAWDGEVDTTLRIIYVKLNIVSGGISNGERPITIASQDLSCLMHFSLSEKVLTPAEANFLFARGILVGGLRSTDVTLRSSFGGSVNVIVYALKKRSDGSETPMVGRASARFTFQGIF